MTQMNRYREIYYAIEAARRDNKITDEECSMLSGFINKEDAILYLKACSDPKTRWKEKLVMSMWGLYLEYIVEAITHKCKYVSFENYRPHDNLILKNQIEVKWKTEVYKQTGYIFQKVKL